MLVFPQENLGSSIGYAVEGAIPASRIHFGVNDAQDVVAGMGDALYRRLKDQIRKVEAYGKSAGAAIARAALIEAGSSETEAERLLDANGWNTPPKAPIEYARGLLGNKLSSDKAQNNTVRSRMSLTNIIQPLGLVTGVSFDLQESANVVGINVEAGSLQQLYRGTISGIVFQSTCNKESYSGGKTAEMHGLESILEYFYHHRVTNTDKDLSKTVLILGSTKLRGWLIGASAEPLNVDYFIWKWTLHLLISPDYKPNIPFSKDNLNQPLLSQNI